MFSPIAARGPICLQHGVGKHMSQLLGVLSSIREALEALPDHVLNAWGGVTHSLSTLPIAYIGVLLVVAVAILYWVSRFVRRWRTGRADDTVYSEHPTMVQGDFRTLSILYLLIVPFVCVIVFVCFRILSGDLHFDGSSIASQLIIGIPMLYISTGFLGFILWNGVSHSEEVRVEPTMIKLVHKIPVGEYLFYSFAFALFKLLLLITLLNFKDWVKLPLREWELEIKLAGGREIPTGEIDNEHLKSRTLTIFAHSIDSVGENEPWLLRWRNIGHLIVYRKGEDPLELRFLPKFRQLKTVVEKLSGNIAKIKASDGSTIDASTEDYAAVGADE